jgi:hypothetical protein
MNLDKLTGVQIVDDPVLEFYDETENFIEFNALSNPLIETDFPN